MKTGADAVVLPAARSRTNDFIALAKPRLNLLVVASSLAGYVMGGGEISDAVRVVGTVVGTALVASGASAFNQVIERRTDSLMRRTRRRPLPDGRLQPGESLVFGGILSIAGLLILGAAVNLLSAVVALATLVSYAAIYTPLKLRSSFATVVGAIPGALPPVIGWAAARGTLSQGAWVLFAILFFWQLPHFLAIAWIYREDYARAGFPMLPVIEPDGRSTGRQAVYYCAALLPVSLAPTLIGMTGTAYFIGALLLTLLFLALTLQFARTRAVPDARRLFFGSIIYLPILWAIMIAGRINH
ncbi:MAG: heme o synthase [Acidobacteriota bacterium]